MGARVADLESNISRIGNSGSAVRLEEEAWCSQFRNGSNPWMARYMYGLMFLAANLLAWVARDYGHGAMTEINRLKGCHGTKDCLGAEGVLRVSLGCFTFYIIMFLSTVGNSKLDNRRDSWHSGWWAIKIVLLVGLMIIPFLIPAPLIQLYGEIAHFGAGVFLLIQLISIIGFITWLNDCFQSDEKAERCHLYVMLFSTMAYVICIVGIILMYIWYTPDPSCLLNIFFITWTLVLLQLMTSVSLHPKIKSGYLTPGLMGLYIVFICWCAIRSEPAGESCNRKAESSNRTDWLTIISFVVALLAMVIATFSTGIDSQCFQVSSQNQIDLFIAPFMEFPEIKIT
ncbi:hypothetical protein SAY86_026931 [Trapa natans]|uniref:Serine incorporator n=1 Tax=Trapa natans TaxID=22666 RepID=A0AAN7QII0_TRANT|nr:hypothetical protein SAY86_026931 [Trapa natans]